jgi:hypothetical protein
MDAYENGYAQGSAAEKARIIKLLNNERKQFVFNSAQAWVLDEMLKLIEEGKK